VHRLFQTSAAVAVSGIRRSSSSKASSLFATCLSAVPAKLEQIPAAKRLCKSDENHFSEILQTLSFARQAHKKAEENQLKPTKKRPRESKPSKTRSISLREMVSPADQIVAETKWTAGDK
jgi:hypothetical protein